MNFEFFFILLRSTDVRRKILNRFFLNFKHLKKTLRILIETFSWQNQNKTAIKISDSNFYILFSYTNTDKNLHEI